MSSTIDSVEQLLSKLIALGSVNPAFAHPELEANKVGEEICGRWVASYLERLGAHTEMQWIAEGRPNVIAKFPTHQPDKPVLLFAPHLDTVGVEGMTIDPFAGEIRDGAVWGRGASDTKGSVAAMLHALRECRSTIPTLPYEVHFVGLANEECAQGGAKEFVREHRADFAIVGEPSSLEAVHAHKGIAQMRVLTRGRAAHASQPDQGENAIDAMARALVWFKATACQDLARSVCPVLGPATISTGTIRGGSAVNVIPDFCETAFDLRLVPGQDLHTWIAQLQEQGRQIEPSLEIVLDRYSPAMRTDPSHPLMQRLIQLGASLASTPCYSDAGVFAAAGIPAVTIGPGSVRQAHTADEHLAIKDLQDGAEFFAKFLRSLAA